MMSEQVNVFHSFPEIAAIGRAALQALCDTWKQTPIAREFAVTELTVTEALDLDFVCQMNHQVQNGEAYYFPMDELLFFIAEHGEFDLIDRERLRARIVRAREAGPDVFRRFRVRLGERLPLFVTCPGCHNTMQTQLSAHRNETIEMYKEVLHCIRGHQPFQITGSDFHFGPND
jgi:hypothetical protein